jgi:hypothetical protein
MEVAVADLPVVVLPSSSESGFLTGQSVRDGADALAPGTEVRVRGADDRFLGIGLIASGRIKPYRVFA